MKFTWRDEPFSGRIGDPDRIITLGAQLQAQARLSGLEHTLDRQDIRAEIYRTLAGHVCRELYAEPMKAAADLRRAMINMEPTQERDTALMLLRALTDTMDYRSVLERADKEPPR